MRVWAILHHLDERRDHDDTSKLWDLQIYLRSNWKATKSDVEFAISQGWVSADESQRNFTITDAGRKQLAVLRPALESFYAAQMRRFREKAQA